jgi:hypothetical protein
MIKLRKTEKIEIYQVELALKEKTKQSPFIAVLILAQELGEIDAFSLKANLLPTLPERACENLLKRLASQEYFYEEEYGCFSLYTLTELGKQSAIDKSFWVGEKGIYNVYISHSNLLNQQIIKTEKVDRSEDDRNGNRITRTPHFISQYHNQILNLNKKEIRIEEIEDKCFQLNSLECSLEIEAKQDDALIRIKEKQTLFESSFEINENELKEELLINTSEFDYDANKKLVLSEFNKDNISFNRKVKLRNPYFQNNQFNSVEIENIRFFPKDENAAIPWYVELLLRNISTYFMTESDFMAYSKKWATEFEPYFEVMIPSKTIFLNYIKSNYEEQDIFYEIAKLETIDYLNY